MNIITVTNLNDSESGSLRAALEYAKLYSPSEEVLIEFDESLSGKLFLQSNLTIPRNATVKLSENVQIDSSLCDLHLEGVLVCKQEIAQFTGNMVLSGGAEMSGKKVLFGADCRITLRDWSGNLSSVFANITTLNFEGNRVDILVENVIGNADFSCIEGKETRYTLESDIENVSIDVANGVTLSMESPVSFSGCSVAMEGTVLIETTCGWKEEVNEYGEPVSVRQGLRFDDDSELSYDTLEIDGTLIFDSDANVNGKKLVLKSSEPLLVYLEGWDGTAPALLKRLGKVESNTESACIRYFVNGNLANAVTYNSSLIESLKGDTFREILFEEIQLGNGDKLSIAAGELLECERFVAVGEGATLTLYDGSTIDVSMGRNPSVYSDSMMGFVSRFGLLVKAGGKLVAQGEVNVNTDLNVFSSASISGGGLVFMGDHRLILHEWNGSVADALNLDISYESGSAAPIIINFVPDGHVVLDTLSCGLNQYYTTSSFMNGGTLTLEENVTLAFAKYFDLYNFDGGDESSFSIHMKKGSRILSDGGKGQIGFSQAVLYGEDCTIDATLSLLGDGRIRGTGIKLTAERAIIFSYDPNDTSEFRPLSLAEIFADADYECTHENAYAVASMSSACSGTYNITEELLDSILPNGCKNVAFDICGWFGGEPTTWNIADGVNWNIDRVQLYNATISFGKNCSLTAIRDASFFDLQNCIVKADDTIFNATLGINSTTKLIGKGYLLAAQVAASYVLDMTTQTFADVAHIFEGVDYKVLRDDAVLSLALTEIDKDFSLNGADCLDEILPAGFSSVAISKIVSAYTDVTDNFTISVSDIALLPKGSIESSQGTLELQSVQLGAGTVIYAGGHCLKMDDMDLSDTTVNVSAQENIITSCYGSGTLQISASATITGCDLSLMELQFENYWGDSYDVDLSGNYWGTTDIEEVRYRLQTLGEGFNITVNNVLSSPIVQQGFTYARKMLSGIQIGQKSRTLLVAFTAEIDPSSVGYASVILRDSRDEVIEIFAIEVVGKQLRLTLADTLDPGDYKLSVNAGMRDKDGNEFVPPVDDAELLVSVSSYADLRVVQSIFNESVCSVDSVDVYFNGSTLVNPDLLKSAARLIGDDGKIYEPVSVEMLTAGEGRLFHLTFEGKQPKGHYVFEISEGCALTDDDDKLSSSYQSDITIFASNISLRSADNDWVLSVNEFSAERFIYYELECSGDDITDRNRIDTLYVCEAPEWDVSKARACSWATFETNMKSGGSIESALPLSTRGLKLNTIYYLFVKSDSQNNISETQEDDNVACVGRLRLSADNWRGDEEMVLNVEQGETVYYEWTPSASDSYVFGLTEADCMLQVSMDGWEDLHKNASLARVIRGDGEEQWALTVEAGQTYRLAITARQDIENLHCDVRTAPPSILNVDSAKLNEGRNVYHLTGTSMDLIESVRLVHETTGEIIASVSLSVLDAGSAEVVFMVDDVNLISLGNYRMEAETKAGKTVSVSDFHVTYEPPFLASRFVEQHYGLYIREGTMIRMQVQTQNAGSGKVHAPLILVREDVQKDILYYGEVKSKDADTMRGRCALLFLADAQDDTPGYVEGGEEYVFTFSERTASDNIATYTEAFNYGDTTQLSESKWDWISSSMQPDGMSDDEWNAWWSDMQPRIGKTVDDYVRFVYTMRDMLLESGVEVGMTMSDITAAFIQRFPDYEHSAAVFGLLMHTDGSAVAGELIDLYINEGGSRTLIDSVITSDDGSFAFGQLKEGCQYEIVTLHAMLLDGQKTNRYTFEQQGMTMKMELYKPYSAEVSVTIEGLLESDADKIVVVMEASDGKIVCLELQGDKWYAEGVEEGEYTLHVSAQDYKPLNEKIEVSGATPVYHAVSVVRLTSIGGTILNAGGEGGLKNKPIVLCSNGTTVATTYTDDSGHYVFSEVEPGDYTIHLTSKDERILREVHAVVGSGNECDTILDQGHVVCGVLRGGKVGSVVALLGDDNVQYSAVLNANGEYTITGVSGGEYRFVVEGVELDPSYRLILGSGESTVSLPTKAAYKGARITGEVKDSALRSVCLYKDGAIVSIASVSENGSFGFTVGEIGEYIVQAYATELPGLSMPCSVMIDSLSDSVNISLEASSGGVWLESVQEIGENAEVSIYKITDSGEECLFYSFGNSLEENVIHNYSPGRYRVCVNDGSRWSEQTFEIQSNEIKRVVLENWTQTGTVNFSLADGGAEAVVVYLYDSNNRLVRYMDVCTDGGGIMEGLIPGDYTAIAIGAEGGAFSEVMLTILPGVVNDTELQLNIMPGKITGQVDGIMAEFLEDTWISLVDSNNREISFAQVSSDGSYQIMTPVLSASYSLVFYNRTTNQESIIKLKQGQSVCNVDMPESAGSLYCADELESFNRDSFLYVYENRVYAQSDSVVESIFNYFDQITQEMESIAMAKPFLTVEDLNNFPVIIQTKRAEASAKRENTRKVTVVSELHSFSEIRELISNSCIGLKEKCKYVSVNINSKLNYNHYSPFVENVLIDLKKCLDSYSQSSFSTFENKLTSLEKFASVVNDVISKFEKDAGLVLVDGMEEALSQLLSCATSIYTRLSHWEDLVLGTGNYNANIKFADVFFGHKLQEKRKNTYAKLSSEIRGYVKIMESLFTSFPELDSFLSKNTMADIKKITDSNFIEQIGGNIGMNGIAIDFGNKRELIKSVRNSLIELNNSVNAISGCVEVLNEVRTSLNVICMLMETCKLSLNQVQMTMADMNEASDMARAQKSILDSLGELYNDNGVKKDDPTHDFVEKETKKAWDPNDITGPAGVGEQNWVADGVQKYIIQCENDAEKAFAYAARVVITQQLDADLDWSTFRIGTMNMGGYYIEVPEGMSEYRARLDWRETHGLYVDVDVSLDYATGVVTWSFTSIDPETEDIPVSPDMGLLAPNFNPPEGDGWVEYSIQPKAGAETGAKVEAQATIVFDWNDPIDTPYIFNTLDKTAPTAAMVTQTRRIDARRYAVSWQGQDAESGIASYDVYVSCDGGEWELWADGITATTAVYTAEQGAHEYRFYVVAKDNVGNVQTEAGDALKLSHDSSKGAPEVMALAATTDPATGFVTGFTATFNVSMNLAAQLKDGSLASLVTLVHTQAGAVNMSDGTFSYDSVTKTLSWKSNTPLRAGEYRLTVQPGALKSSSGVALGAPVIPGFSVRHLMQTVGSYSAPTVADVNGDGLVDLLIGEKTTVDSGSVRLHINVGTAEQPEFGAGQYISTPQGLLTVEATGCLGAAPAVADINGDGLADLLIGKADGTIQLYIQEQPGAEGDGPIWSDYGRIKGIDVGERATPVQADWNSDGRPDLLVGNADGNIVLYLNIGTAEVPAYDSGRYLYDGGSLLSVPEGRSAFVVGDWDGDSLPDIISGNTAGQLVYYHNYGTEGNPLFAGYELLHADGGIFDLPNSPRSRLAAVDWNGDGVLDLVVGAEDGNLHLLSGEKNSAGVVGGLGVEGHPNLDDMPSGSQVLQLSGAYDGSGIYSATVQDNLSSTDRTDYFSLHATADGAFNMALDTSKLDAAVRLSVGVLDGDGLFSVSQELLLTPGAAVDSLPGVAISAGEQLYIRVESVDVSSETNYELSLTGTVPAVGSNLATQNNSAAEATELSSPSAAVTGWVGAGDACDFYRVEMAAAGSLSIGLDELEAAARVRVYEQRADGSLAQLDSRAVKAASGLDATLSLTSGTYFVEVASLDAGAGQYNTAYSLTLEKEEQQAAEEAQERFSNLA